VPGSRALRLNRRKLRVALLALTLVVAAATAIALMLNQSSNLTVTKYSVGEGNVVIRITQLSDTHFTSWSERVARLANLVISTHPDMIVITGDAVSNAEGLNTLRKFLALVREGLPNTPIYAVPGNWERGLGLTGKEARILKEYGGTMLINQYVTLRVKNVNMVVVGLDDMIYGRPNASIIKSLPNADTYVLLVHEPELALKAAKEGFKGLVLAGHCHGGQVKILGHPLLLPQGCPRNMFEGMHKVGNTTLVISRGIGTTILPLRIGSEPEVVVINLRVSSGQESITPSPG